jgi:MinD-like ATPase involved in chromosome partitioning or flagellar assembly
MQLADLGHKVLAIDNNYKFCDLAYYLMVQPEYTVDDLKPYLRSGILERSTVASLTVNVQRNLDVLCGSTMGYVPNTLEVSDIEKIKQLVDEDYDYIIIDNRAGIEHEQVLSLAEIVDRVIIVSLPNAYLGNHYQKLLENLEDEKVKKLKMLIDKSVVVYNRFSETSEFDISRMGNKALEKCKAYKLFFSDKVLDFCNGYKCNLGSENAKEIHNMVLELTNVTQEEANTKSKFPINLGKIGKILNIGGNKA